MRRRKNSGTGTVTALFSMHRGVCFAFCERGGQETVLERCSKQSQCFAWVAHFHVFPWRRRELLRRRPQQLHGTRVLRPTPGASLNRAKGIHQPQHARWAEPVRPHHGSALQRKSISSTVSPTFFPSHNSSPATRGRNGQLGLECPCWRGFVRRRPYSCPAKHLRTNCS